LRYTRFLIQIDDATDFSGSFHLIACVQYVEDTTVNEDTLFCKLIKKWNSGKTTRIVDNFLKEKSIKWSSLYKFISIFTATMFTVTP
jgi:hypothetical protein